MKTFIRTLCVISVVLLAESINTSAFAGSDEYAQKTPPSLAAAGAKLDAILTGWQYPYALETCLSELPETVELKKLQSDLREKALSDPTVIAARAESDKADVRYESWTKGELRKTTVPFLNQLGATSSLRMNKMTRIERNGKQLLPTKETQHLFDALNKIYEEKEKDFNAMNSARSAANKALDDAMIVAKNADIPLRDRIKELQNKQRIAFNSLLEFDPKIQATRKSYEILRIKYMEQLTDLLKIDDRLKKSTKTATLQSKFDKAYDKTNELERRTVESAEAYQRQMIATGRSFPNPGDWITFWEHQVPLVKNPDGGKMSFHFNSDELLKIRPQLAPICLKLAQASVLQAQYDEAEMQQILKFKKLPKDSQRRPLDFIELAKMPCVAAPAATKIFTAYRASPFNRAAYDAAVAEYKAQSKPVPQDATKVSPTMHWPELLDPMPQTDRIDRISAKSTDMPAAPRFLWYLWKKDINGNFEKQLVMEMGAMGPELFNSITGDGSLERAKIAAHAKTPGYPTYTYSVARAEACAIFEKVYAKNKQAQ